MSGRKQAARAISALALISALTAFVLSAAQLLYLYVGLSESYCRLLAR